MKWILVASLFLIGCAKEATQDWSTLAEQGPAKSRAPISNDHTGCRYLDAARDYQQMPLTGATLEVLWGTVFIKYPDGRTEQPSGTQIVLNECILAIDSSMNFEVVYR